MNLAITGASGFIGSALCARLILDGHALTLLTHGAPRDASASNKRWLHWTPGAAGEWEKAREIYRWFTPLLHLDVSTKFVQYIKLAVQETGLGKEWVRAPRFVLKGEERKRVLKIIHDGIAKRPKIPKNWKLNSGK